MSSANQDTQCRRGCCWNPWESVCGLDWECLCHITDPRHLERSRPQMHVCKEENCGVCS